MRFRLKQWVSRLPFKTLFEECSGMIDKPFSEMKVGDKKVSTGRTITESAIENFAMFLGSWLEQQPTEEFARHSI